MSENRYLSRFDSYNRSIMRHALNSGNLGLCEALIEKAERDVRGVIEND